MGWPGTTGTCCHPQSASDYTISLSHSPHPASRATWKQLWESQQTAQDGHALTFQSIFKLRTHTGYKNGVHVGLHIQLGIYRGCFYLRLLHVFTCWHFPGRCVYLLVPHWETDGIAWKQIICHGRNMWQTAFNSAYLYSAPHWLNGNGTRTEVAPRLCIHKGTSKHRVRHNRDLVRLNDWNVSVFSIEKKKTTTVRLLNNSFVCACLFPFSLWRFGFVIRGLAQKRWHGVCQWEPWLVLCLTLVHTHTHTPPPTTHWHTVAYTTLP